MAEKRKTKAKDGRITVYLDPEMVSRARRVVYYTPGLTLSWLVERSVEQSVVEYEEKYQERFGEEIPEIPGGRLPAGVKVKKK